jgi:hypothetical protein
MRGARAWVATALATVLSGCGQSDRVAGGTSSEVPNALNGQILDGQGRPVVGAAVRALPSLAFADSGLVVDTVRTDSAGRWFLAVPPGSWTVVAQGPAGWSMRDGFPDGKRHLDTLRSPVWVSGSVGAGFTNTRIWLRGTEISAVADSTGKFLLGPLPSGDLRLHIKADSVVQDAAVHADPGQVLSTGTWISANWGQEDYALWPSARTAVIDFANSGAGVASDHALFPIPVRLDTVLDVKGIDPVGLRFDDGKGKPYPFSLSWDAAKGHATAWVQLDTANGSSAKHFLRALWGRRVPVPRDMPPVFAAKAHFTGAWHCDSASETFSGLDLRWTGSQAGTGTVDGARILAGSGSWTTDSVTLGGSNSWSISFWVRLDAKPSGDKVLAGFTGGPDSANWGISVRDDLTLRVWSGARASDTLAAAAGLTLSVWTHLVATFDATSSRIGLVVDTTAYSRKTVIFPKSSRQPMGGGSGLVAAYDEIRFSDTARAIQWGQLERQTQTTGIPWLRW